MKELGLYMLVLNNATMQFVEQVVPPAQCQTLHDAFLKWQRVGIEVLKSGIDSPNQSNPELTKQYQDATHAFTDEMARLSAIEADEDGISTSESANR